MQARAKVRGLPLIAALTAVAACKGESPGPKAKPAAQKASADPAAKDTRESTDPNSADAWAWDVPGGLSTPKVPADNPMSAAKVALGHRLFMDKRLSGDGSRSCYSCHQNELGNADGRTKALGAHGKELSRNTPTIWNVAYHEGLYWDGRASSLEKQAIGALKGGNMGLGDGLDAKARELGQLPEYAKDFRAVFGLGDGDDVTPLHVAQALSAYERTLLCGDTPFDRRKMSEEAKAGHKLFTGKAACVSCHPPPNFTDGIFHNSGLGGAADGKVDEGDDIGRGKVTEDPNDNFRFRTPTLRNVAKTAPYFHDGSAETLEEAVRFMASGAKRGAPGLDPGLTDVKLTDEEVAQVVAFLQALDCPGTLEVIGDQSAEGIAIPG